MLNKVELLGNLGADAQVNYTHNGVAVANLRLATSERWRDKEGNTQERTEWHRIAFFRVPEKLIPHLTKGRQLMIEGKLETHKYTGEDGIERFNTQVVVRPGKGSLKLLNRPHSTDEVK